MVKNKLVVKSRHPAALNLLKNHAPECVDDLAWPKDFRELLGQIIETKRIRVIAAGTPGVGKTCGAELLIRLLDLDAIWLRGIKGGGIDEIKEAVVAASMVSLEGKRRAIIIDEADSYSSHALNVLRGDTMEDDDVAFIIMCNDAAKIPDAVRSRCDMFIFDASDKAQANALQREQLRRALEILEAEGIAADPDQVKAVLAPHKTDFRSGLRALERWMSRLGSEATTASSNITVPTQCLTADVDDEIDKDAATNSDYDDTVGNYPAIGGDTDGHARVANETSALLSTIRGIFEEHLVLPSGGSTALALFTMLAYAKDAVDYMPILAIVSPQKECGKTATLDLLSMLIDGAVSTVNITPAAVFEKADEGVPLLIDEADLFLSKNSDLIRLLNGGIRRSSAKVYRAGNKSYSVWCPKIIARIGAIEPATLASRCIKIRMRRSLPDEVRARVRPQLEEAFAPLRERRESWVANSKKIIEMSDPQMPTGFRGRLADNWRGLLAIADLAGKHWGALARTAAMALEDMGGAELDLGTLLLQDIREILADGGIQQIFSADLADLLRKKADRPWVTWSRYPQREIAKILDPYGIRPKNIRIFPRQAKGYTADQFEDTFRRFLNGQSAEAA